MKILFTVFVCVIRLTCYSQDEVYDQFVLQSSLPNEIRVSMFDRDLFEKFDLSDEPNPFYLRGDFNGDNKLDIAISVIDKVNKKGGIIVFFSDTDYRVIGAGKSLINRDMDDFGWMDAWSVYAKKDVDLGVGETETIKLKSEAILAIKTESSSGIIYWDGTEFKWYQQGD